MTGSRTPRSGGWWSLKRTEQVTSGDVNPTRGHEVPDTELGLRDVLLVATLIALVVLLHLGMPGPIPSGADGGNWLAIARERLGTDVMAAEVAYPPIFPLLVAAGLSWLGAMPSLVVAALLAKGLFVLAIYICCRPIGRLYAVGAAVCSGVAGAQLEAYAWGGYPQLMATGFGLLAVFFVVRWAGDRRRASLVLGSVFAILTFATHTLIGGLLLVALPVAMAHWLFLTKARRGDWLRGAAGVFSLVIPAGIFTVVSTVTGSREGMSAVLNPYGLSLIESLEQTIRDAVLPWIVVTVLGVAGLVVREVKGPQAATTAVGSSWSLVGLAFLLSTGEPRALLLTQVGLIVLACLTVRRVLAWIGPRKVGGTHRKARRRVFAVVVTLVISMMSAIVVGGIASYAAATDWYRVANEDVLDALDWLKDHSAADDLMLASNGPNGNPLGWWVQGFGQRRTYTSIDGRFLAFSDEREQAEIAEQIFDPATAMSVVRAFLDEHGIDFLVVDRRGSNAGWLAGDVAAEFTMLWESPSVAILDADVH